MKAKCNWQKKMVVSVLVLVLAGAAFAQDEAVSEMGAVDLDVTTTSKYIWRGYDVFDDHAANFFSVNWDAFNSGLNFNVWYAVPWGGTNEDATEIDYTVSYGMTFLEDEAWAMDVGVNYIYFNFPKGGRSDGFVDTQEIGVSIALPNLIPVGDSALVPSYYGAKLWPTDDDLGFDVFGGYHVFALGYDMPLPETDMVLNLFADLNYNDGIFGAMHEFTHSTIGASTSFDFDPITVTPFVNFQWTISDDFADMANGGDDYELWGGVSLAYSF